MVQCGRQQMFGCSTLPTGIQTFNGTNFNIAGANGGNNAWFSSVAANNGPGTVSVTIPVNVVGATSVSTLMNTFWGQSGTSYDMITFTGTGGVSYSVNLTGNSSVRDYNNYIWTNSVSGPTQMAWTNDGSQRWTSRRFSFLLHSRTKHSNRLLSPIAATPFLRGCFLPALTVDPIRPRSGAGLAGVGRRRSASGGIVFPPKTFS